MKKVLAREFLWLLFAIVAAVPLGFVFLHFLAASPESQNYTEEEMTFLSGLYLLGVILSFVGIYLIRLIVASLRVLTAGN